MRKMPFLALAVLLAALASTALGAAPASPARPVGRVAVMTQNLYVGADIFRVFDAQTPADVPAVVSGILGTVLATDFPARAEALAVEIAHRRPHLVGLQEVALLRVQSPGDFLAGNPLAAQDVLFDYLDLLLAALERHGARYRVAAEVANADVELPFVAGFGGAGPLLDDVRLTDRDVILARADVATRHPLARNYAAAFEVPLAGTTVRFLRGFTAVEAEVADRRLRFVDTHLEVASPAPAIQAAQIQELIAEVHAEDLPVILVGDLNSGPSDPFPRPYAQLAAEGFVDTWLRRLGRPDPGWTCCQSETLDNPVSALSERIDHVMVRNRRRLGPFDAVGPVRAEVVGDTPRERTTSGLWPSDHGGVATAFVLPVGPSRP